MDKGLMQSKRAMQSSDPVWLLSVVFLLPCLSVLAALFVSHDALLLVYLLAAAMVFASGLRLRAAFADHLFLLLVGSVALSLLLSTTLVSENISGFDIHQEYALFQQVLESGIWRPDISLPYNSALSVTILPTIISSVCSLDGTVVFKTVYPFLFSFVPMILYRIYRRILTPEAAFISVFVFLSYPSSYFDMVQLARQMIAEVIMVLLLLMVFSAGFKRTRSGGFLVLLLTIGLITSHYSLALIYTLLIAFSFIVSVIFARWSWGIEALTNVRLLAITLVASLCWYAFVAGGAILQQISILSSLVLGGFSDFLNPTSRPAVVMDALALTPVNAGFLHLVNRATQYIVLFCIILGFLIFIRKTTKNPSAIMMRSPMTASMGLLVGAVVLPFASATLNMSRIYDIALLSVSPCFYIGAAKITGGLQRLANFLTRSRIRLKMGVSVLAAALFMYLLFTSGWVWAITNDKPTSVVLDLERMENYSQDVGVKVEYYDWYTLSEDVQAARWMRSYNVAEHEICADWISHYHVLDSYGGYDASGGSFLPFCHFDLEYGYLSVMNSNTGLATRVSNEIKGNLAWLPIYTALGRFTHSENRIYSNGATIYEGFV